MAKKKTYTKRQREQAKEFWMAGVRLKTICEVIGINSQRVILNWRQRYEWEKKASHQVVEQNLCQRYNRIIDQEAPFSKADREELDFMSNELLKLAKVEGLKSGQNNHKGRPLGVKNGKGKDKPLKTNDVSQLTTEDFAQFRKDNLYPHQMLWWEAGQNPETRRTRFILKSRKIGATWFFAYEAFEDAVLNGNNQAFISATRQQAEIFKAYIAAISKEFFGISLRGNPTTLKLANDKEVTLNYLSTNVLSAQSYGGCVYFDECFWTRNFQQLWDVASPIATFKEHKRTLISTPSAISHEAYNKWCGEEYNKGRSDEEQVSIDLSHDALRLGELGADYIWRHMITLADAINCFRFDSENNRWGLKNYQFDRIDIDEIQRETAPEKYKVYYGCQFIDDADSYFSLSQLISMGRDPYHAPYFNPNADRPYGNRQTTAGYDPGGKHHFDAAALLSVPTGERDKFYMLEHHMMRHMPSYEQFGKIREWNEFYNLIHFEFDTTGPGQDMEKYAMEEFPHCVPVRYTPDYKTSMVNKASAVFSADRFRYNANDTEVPLSFMTIKQTVTPTTNQITYISSESEKVGHGDLAWAIMHAMMIEELIPEEHDGEHDSVEF